MSDRNAHICFDFGELTARERYKLLIGTVVPRPIAFVTTVDEQGRVNAAPFSFFNGVSDNPPMVMIAINGRKIGLPEDKDTLSNVRATGEFAVNVVCTDVNVAPVITSDGGGDSANVNVVENTTAVTTVTATDANADTLTYSIIGGADQALFDIDANTGALTFKTAPDFESPADIDGDNVYVVTVEVADGRGGVDSQVISITVTDADEVAPVVTVNSISTSDSTQKQATYSEKNPHTDWITRSDMVRLENLMGATALGWIMRVISRRPCL